MAHGTKRDKGGDRFGTSDAADGKELGTCEPFDTVI
jgi:hypothetical protein